MAERLFDYKCSECEHVDEVWTDDASKVLDCPECGKPAFNRAYLQFGILQQKVTDSSNSWVGSKSRRAYGEGKANNGLL